LHESFEKTHGKIDPIRHADSSQVLALHQYNKAVYQTADTKFARCSLLPGSIDFLFALYLLGIDSRQLYLLG
jgi:hypothetical protein